MNKRRQRWLAARLGMTALVASEMLVLSAHVARVLSSPFLAIRRLEEAKAVIEATPGAVDSDQAAKISAELGQPV